METKTTTTTIATTALEIFSYEGEINIRTVRDDNGEVWFVAKDVAQALEYSEATISNMESTIAHVPVIWKGRYPIPTLGGKQSMWCLSEQGVYFFLGRSDKPRALPFQMWLAGEVMPSIRRTGMYIYGQTLEAYEQDNKSLRMKVAELEDKLDKVRASSNLGCVMIAQEGSITLFDAAHFLSQKGINVGAIRLYKRCRELNLLCKRKGRQFNQPTQTAITKGLLNAEVCGGFKPIAMVTPKGLEYLTDLFMQEQLPVLFLIDMEDKKALAEA